MDNHHGFLRNPGARNTSISVPNHQTVWQALLDMDAPRRALTELHPAKELMERGRDGWPLEVLKRILVSRLV